MDSGDESPVRSGNYKGLAYLITLSRSEKLNALDRRMWELLLREINNACKSDLAAVLVEGGEAAFSAGDDIEVMYRFRNPEEAHEFFNRIGAVLESLLSCPKPVVCAVRGLAVGGGAELLLACDIVIASEKAWISFPEVALGLLPPFLVTAGTLTLGRKRVAYLALTGQRLSATEAQKLGIIDEVVPDGDIDDAIEELLRELAGYPREALSAIKGLLAKSVDRKLVQEALEALAALSLTESAKERMRLFIDHKFKPAAEGR